MQIKIIAIGKTDNLQLNHLIEAYNARLKHYIKVEWQVIPELKNAKNFSHELQKQKEGQLILQQITPSDVLVLLDENGKQFSSVGFSDYLQKKMNQGNKQLVLVIGGPFGFSDEVYQRSKESISLSKMTFSHQMIRLFLVEQLYRGMTILKGESYHHE